MKTVVVAEPTAVYSKQLENIIRAAGLEVITCPGPWPPALRCIRCDVGYCPFTDAADALIYDPDLVARAPDGTIRHLAVESARGNPDVPLLLAWPGAETPASVAEVQAQVPSARIAPKDPTALVSLLHEMIREETA